MPAEQQQQEERFRHKQQLPSNQNKNPGPAGHCDPGMGVADHNASFIASVKRFQSL
jgi:hypothetical protein